MAAAGHALEQALAYYRAPAMLAMAAQRPLPDDVIELLRLAAGDAAQATASAEASGEPPQRVVEAAVFFVQQVMFTAEADPHRMLGVNPNAPPARIREHYRWLIRWLHPDRNADEWDSVYTDRVTRAWQSLRRSGALAGEGDVYTELPERRAHPRPETPAAAPSVLGATRMAHISREQPAAPMLSARTARRLPGFVLGGLGLIAVSLVALLWYAQQNPLKPRLAVQGNPLPTAAPPVGGNSFPTAAPPAGGTSVPTPEPLAGGTPVPTPEPHVGGTSVPTPEPPVGGNSFPTAEPLVGGTSVPTPEPPGGGNSFPTAPAVPTARLPEAVGNEFPPTAAPLAATPVGGPSGPKPSDQLTAPPPKSFGPEGPPTGSAEIQEAAAHAVLTRFTTAYAAGDLTTLMRLFTRDAINNRGGRDAIAYDYQSLFSNSRERRLDLQPNGWITRDDGAVVLAAYEAWVKEGRLRPGTTSRGAIRFTLRREDGELRISQVIHD